MPADKKNMWSGRFSTGMNPDMEKLSVSLPFDKRLYREDIQCTLAQAKALEDSGVLSVSEQKKITAALKSIETALSRDKSLFNAGDEDIHMAIERILTDKTGSTGKKIHTGRSRNDQIATDFRIFIKRQCANLIKNILGLQSAIKTKAEQYLGTIMAGYTHLQQAQPVLVSHYLMSFFWALERDKSRLRHAIQSSDELPLGSGALAGSAFSFDRRKSAKMLGFKRPSPNSIDAVSHRDFAMEYLSTLAILGNLLSRYAEDLIIWNSSEFGIVEIGEGFTTGSSMMPQKKNPDSLELIRGKAGRLLGNFCSLYTAAKGAPLCYARDLQEDKEPVFDSTDTLSTCLAVMTHVVSSLVFRKDNIRRHLKPEILATDFADSLVEWGIPFREAHKITGAMVKKAEKLNCPFNELPNEALDDIRPGLSKIKIPGYLQSVNKRNIPGGTGLKSVKAQLRRASKILTQSA